MTRAARKGPDLSSFDGKQEPDSSLHAKTVPLSPSTLTASPANLDKTGPASPHDQASPSSVTTSTPAIQSPQTQEQQHTRTQCPTEEAYADAATVATAAAGDLPTGPSETAIAPPSHRDGDASNSGAPSSAPSAPAASAEAAAGASGQQQPAAALADHPGSTPQQQQQPSSVPKSPLTFDDLLPLLTSQNRTSSTGGTLLELFGSGSYRLTRDSSNLSGVLQRLSSGLGSGGGLLASPLLRNTTTSPLGTGLGALDAFSSPGSGAGLSPDLLALLNTHPGLHRGASNDWMPALPWPSLGPSTNAPVPDTNTNTHTHTNNHANSDQQQQPLPTDSTQSQQQQQQLQSSATAAAAAATAAANDPAEGRPSISLSAQGSPLLSNAQGKLQLHHLQIGGDRLFNSPSIPPPGAPNAAYPQPHHFFGPPGSNLPPPPSAAAATAAAAGMQQQQPGASGFPPTGLQGFNPTGGFLYPTGWPATGPAPHLAPPTGLNPQLTHMSSHPTGHTFGHPTGHTTTGQASSTISAAVAAQLASGGGPPPGSLGPPDAFQLALSPEQAREAARAARQYRKQVLQQKKAQRAAAAAAAGQQDGTKTESRRARGPRPVYTSHEERLRAKREQQQKAAAAQAAAEAAAAAAAPGLRPVTTASARAATAAAAASMSLAAAALPSAQGVWAPPQLQLSPPGGPNNNMPPGPLPPPLPGPLLPYPQGPPSYPSGPQGTTTLENPQGLGGFQQQQQQQQMLRTPPAGYMPWTGGPLGAAGVAGGLVGPSDSSTDTDDMSTDSDDAANAAAAAGTQPPAFVGAAAHPLSGVSGASAAAAAAAGAAGGLQVPGSVLRRDTAQSSNLPISPRTAAAAGMAAAAAAGPGFQQLGGYGVLPASAESLMQFHHQQQQQLQYHQQQIQYLQQQQHQQQLRMWTHNTWMQAAAGGTTGPPAAAAAPGSNSLDVNQAGVNKQWVPTGPTSSQPQQQQQQMHSPQDPAATALAASPSQHHHQQQQQQQGTNITLVRQGSLAAGRARRQIKLTAAAAAAAAAATDSDSDAGYDRRPQGAGAGSSSRQGSGRRGGAAGGGRGSKRGRAERGDSGSDGGLDAAAAAGATSSSDFSETEVTRRRVTRRNSNTPADATDPAAAAAAAAGGGAASGSRRSSSGRANKRGGAGDGASGGKGSPGVSSAGGEAARPVFVDTRSKYRGVTRHRRSGRWEAHIWIKELGRQVYLGGYDIEEAAAEAYDMAALKSKGKGCPTNFPAERYADVLDNMKGVTLEGLIMAVRRQSQGFSRGSSAYRGVTAHPSGRWESRIGIPGSKHVYLGLYNQEAAAAQAYDGALVRFKGAAAATNFSVVLYQQQLAEHHQVKLAASQGLLQDILQLQSGPEFELFIKSGVAAFGMAVSDTAWGLAQADTAAGTAANGGADAAAAEGAAGEPSGAAATADEQEG